MSHPAIVSSTNRTKTTLVWLDVGGTFTDCIVSPPNAPQRIGKILSSGLVPFIGQVSSNGRTISFHDQSDWPDSFWVGGKLRLLTDSSKAETDKQRLIVGFERLATEPPSDGSFAYQLHLESSIDSESGHLRFELDGDIEAPVLAVRKLLRIPLLAELPQLSIRLGTTRGTNALLTRTGAKVGLIITQGFRDLPWIGSQERPNLFDMNIIKPQPLLFDVLEVDERLAADGSIIKPLQIDLLDETLRKWKAAGIESIAISLMHSYRNPVHEKQVARIASDSGFLEISQSHRIAPLIKLISRMETSVVDAYLNPIVQGYLERLQTQFGGSSKATIQVMSSSGAMLPIGDFRGRDSVLSGPAGGVIAIHKLATAFGSERVLAFDMGGTSTDVSRCDHGLPLQFEGVKAGIRMMTPMLNIETVAAGGGSICIFDGVQMRVGPHSAGSNPGPACYGRGGPLTVTDLNIILGRIPITAIPIPIDIDAARMRLSEIGTAMREKGSVLDDLTIASGFLQIANQHMVEAIRQVSVGQGADPREHLLVGFGGAAGQHLCQVAETLGVTRLLDPPLAGLLSAQGMGLAQHSLHGTIGIYQLLSEVAPSRLLESIGQLQNELQEQLGSPVASEFTASLQFELRYQSTEKTLLISQVAWEEIRPRFEDAHKRQYGYILPNRPLELVAIRLSVSLPVETVLPEITRCPSHSPGSNVTQKVFSQSQWLDFPVFHRNQLFPGHRFNGPAIVLNAGHVTVIESRWYAEVLSDGSLLIERVTDKLEQPATVPTTGQTERDRHDQSSTEDIIAREVLSKRLVSIAARMGEVLERTAISVNVKERRDFSCAIFDKRGFLLANAPHVPVHLGAMGQTIRMLLDDFPNLQSGDCLITNDPFRGGSHLPDVTVVTPVFDPRTSEIAFFAANRAHHAEIGGIRPGSMSPEAKTLTEEGCLLPGDYLTRAGELQLSTLRQRLLSARYPTRNIEENLADIAAQQAANQRGLSELESLITEYEPTELNLILEEIQRVSYEHVRQWLSSNKFERQTFTDFMDDEWRISVTIEKIASSLLGTESKQSCPPVLRLNFEGSSPIHPGNFNANPAIVSAAVIYCLRCMINEDIPLNEGLLRAIDLRIPSSFLNPIVESPTAEKPAVAAGNVETSQRIVDVILGAFGVAAASQGTMNNFLFGSSHFGFYETIGGGSGATKSNHGADAVHTHMTNTRLTDAEVIESRYPVRLTAFRIRRGSGGSGKHRGGDGIEREFEFLAPLSVSLISSRRDKFAPYGLEGGHPGTCGENWLLETGSEWRKLPGIAQFSVKNGDRLLIKTPGGGGFGLP